MTFCPLKSAREIFPPPLVAAENFGATSPAFNFNSIVLAIKVDRRLTPMDADKNQIHPRLSEFIRGSLFGRWQTRGVGSKLLGAIPDVKETGRRREQSRAENPGREEFPVK